MGKSWDTEKIEKFIDSISVAYDKYTDASRLLEDGFAKYYYNDTYRGQAAEASKNFIGDGQNKLHLKQHDIQRRLVYKYYDMLDSFKDKVDPSPIARIDIDVLGNLKKDFKVFYNVTDVEGYAIERKARYIMSKFGNINGNFNLPSYRIEDEMYEDLCGAGGFLDKCIRMFEEFDEEMCTDIDQSGIENDLDDLMGKITTTISGLDIIHVHVEDVLKKSVGLTTLSLANLPQIYYTIPSFFKSLNLFGKNSNAAGQTKTKVDTITVDDSKRVRIGTVSENFITITGLYDANGKPITGYGGNQHWFDASTNPELGQMLSDRGCGVIASVNQYLYLTGQTTISKAAYMNLVYRFMKADDQPYSRQATHAECREQAMRGNIIKGELPSQMTTYVSSMCEKKGVTVSSSWDYVQDYEADYEDMKKQLKNGIPVIWGQSDFGGENVKYYTYDASTGEYTNRNNYGASSHYVVVTGAYEETDASGNVRRMVEISSCEKKYYVDYDQYIEVVGDNPSNRPFSSITHTTIK